jgi:opacity protein-like surface antigen
MRKILFFTMLSLSTTITLAEVGDNFFSIKLGSSNSNTTGITTFKDQIGTGAAGETTDKDLGKSDIMEIGIGSYFSETFSGEISLAQRNGFKYATTHTKSDGVADTTLRYKADVESLAVFINGYFNAQPLSIIQTSVTPYLGVGVGFSRNKMGAVDITQVSDGVSLGNAASNTETEFAYKLALGTLINLSDSVSVDLNYQYVDLGNIKSGTNLSWDSRDLNSPFIGPEITSSEFNVGLQIVF